MSEPTTPRRSRRLRTKLIVAALSVVIALAGAEVVARLSWPYLTPASKVGQVGRAIDIVYHTPRGRRFIPGTFVTIHQHATSGLDVAMRINDLGLRDDPVPQPKPDHEVRILVLGDSITCGDYLPAEAVYVKRIEHYLNAAPPVAGKRYRTINGGIGDVGVETCINILEDIGLATEPDVVLLAFYLNDSRPPWGFPGELGSRGWLQRHSVLLDNLHRRFRLRTWQQANQERFAWIDALDDLNWMEDPQAFKQLASLAAHDWGAAWSESSWPMVEAQLKRLDTLAKANGFDVVVVMFPVGFQLDTSFVDDAPQQRMRTITEQYNWPMIDLLPVMREREGPDLLYDQCHPNAEGNDLIGRVLAERLSQSVLGDGP